MSTTPEEPHQVDDQPKFSPQLDEKQHAILLKLLGSKCIIVSLGVLQLFSITIPPEHVKWKRREKCIACIAKHDEKPSMEIIVLNLEKKKIYWEKEIPSEELQYKPIKPLFHLILDADEGMIGLHFKSDVEARSICEWIHGKLSSCENCPSDSQATSAPSTDVTNTTAPSSQSKFSLFKHLKPKTKRLGKDKISAAFDFAHIHHMAYNAEKDNFTYDFMDSTAKYNIFKTKKDLFSGKNLEKLLEAVGVTHSELSDQENDEVKLPESDDSKSIDTKSSLEDILEIPTIENIEESKSSYKISNVSENLEFNKIMSELKIYQRESYYTKDFSVPLTPKIIDFDYANEEDEEDVNKEDGDQENEKPENTTGETNSQISHTFGTTKKDIFAQIGVDALRAFQNRSLRLSQFEPKKSKENLENSVEKDSSEEGASKGVSSTLATATARELTCPLPAPRRSKLYQSNENLLLDYTLENVQETHKNLI